MSSQGVESSKEASNNPGLDCILLEDSSLTLAVALGPEINFRVCLWVLIGPHHIVICWLSIQRFVFFSYILPGDQQGRFRSTELVNSSLPSESIVSFHFHVPQYVRGPRTVQQIAGWKYRSTTFGSGLN